MQHDLIIVGAGLAGLALARALAPRGLDVVVLEARSRIGGRILSHRTVAGSYDLGPAWIWPAMQPRIAHIVQSAGLAVYEQAEAGGFIYQDHQGSTQRLAHGFRQEPPSLRIRGGIEALTAAIARDCEPDSIRLGHRVLRVLMNEKGVAVTTESPDGIVTLHASRVALAVPPRLLGAIDILPKFPAALSTRLAAVPTWMAGQAKALALYDRAHWRDANLSGSAFSQCGPLTEVHDASLPDASGAALFGFFGWEAARRAAQGTALTDQVVAQLGVLFGAGAGRPRQLVIQDWATERFTATAADRVADAAHPEYRPIPLPEPWSHRLTLSGAEMAPEFGGYLEGALARAEAAATWVSRSLISA